MQKGLGRAFGIWGAFVTQFTLLVFIISASLFAWAAHGMLKADFYKDWPFTPEGSRSYLAQIDREFEIILQASDQADNILLSLDAFNEILQFHELIFTAVQEAQDLDYIDGELIATGLDSQTSYSDICRRYGTSLD